MVAHELRRPGDVVDLGLVHFDHERLDVYNAAVDFVVLDHTILSDLPTGHGDLADQRRRAG